MAPVDGAAAPLRLRFLGSGDAFPSGGRLQTCLCLDGPGGRILLDCGATALVAMKRAGIDPATVGWIFLTHLHGDHFGGVPFVVLDGQFARRETPLVVAGPPGTPDRVTAAMEVLFPGSSRVARRFATDVVELCPGARHADRPADRHRLSRGARERRAILRAPGRLGGQGRSRIPATPNGAKRSSTPREAPISSSARRTPSSGESASSWITRLSPKTSPGSERDASF